MQLSRKHFVSALGVTAGALSTSASSLAADEPGERAPVHFHILKPNEFDRAAMMSVLSSAHPHKQVFHASGPLLIAPGVSSLYLHMQNSMNAHEFSFGFGKNGYIPLGVLLGASAVLALNDDLWKKYGFGDALKLAPSNIYYKATSDLSKPASPDDPAGIYQDWSAQAIMHRGGKFMVCHNAMTAVAALFAPKAGVTPQAALAEFERGVLPGFLVVPAGVAAIQLAQQHGYTLFAII